MGWHFGRQRNRSGGGPAGGASGTAAHGPEPMHSRSLPTATDGCAWRRPPAGEVEAVRSSDIAGAPRTLETGGGHARLVSAPARLPFASGHEREGNDVGVDGYHDALDLPRRTLDMTGSGGIAGSHGRTEGTSKMARVWWDHRRATPVRLPNRVNVNPAAGSALDWANRQRVTEGCKHASGGSRVLLTGHIECDNFHQPKTACVISATLRTDFRAESPA